MWGKPRSRVRDAQKTVRRLIADVRKKERDARRFQNEFDTIARYCNATALELEQLLEELQNEPPDS